MWLERSCWWSKAHLGVSSRATAVRGSAVQAHPSLRTAECPKRLTSWWRSGRGSAVHSSHAGTEGRHMSTLTCSHVINHTRVRPGRGGLTGPLAARNLASISEASLAENLSDFHQLIRVCDPRFRSRKWGMTSRQSRFGPALMAPPNGGSGREPELKVFDCGAFTSIVLL